MRAESPASESPSASLVLGGGCFWCLEAAYELVPGVLDVVSGYSGGHVENPGYREVCEKRTGHAEVVRITYDPSKVGPGRLLELFWRIHDPTTKDRQGADVGPQYRSIILYADQAQKEAAEKAVREAQPGFASPIVTELVPLVRFWPAEDYHQDYFAKNPEQGYCRYVVREKVDKMRKALGE